MRLAAVWIESLSSSFVVGQSYKPLMVFVAIRKESTDWRPSQQRVIALTILLISTGSSAPFRLRTCIDVCAELSVCLEVAVPVCAKNVSISVVDLAYSERGLGDVKGLILM